MPYNEKLLEETFYMRYRSAQTRLLARKLMCRSAELRARVRAAERHAAALAIDRHSPNLIPRLVVTVYSEEANRPNTGLHLASLKNVQSARFLSVCSPRFR